MSEIAVPFAGLHPITIAVADLVSNRDDGVSFHQAVEAVGCALGIVAATRMGLGGSDIAAFKEHLDAGMMKGADAAVTAVQERWIAMHGGRQ